MTNSFSYQVKPELNNLFDYLVVYLTLSPFRWHPQESRGSVLYLFCSAHDVCIICMVVLISKIFLFHNIKHVNKT